MEPDPVEYIIIEFPGHEFSGEIAPAIADLVERGLVHIIDLIFVKKDAEGDIEFFEYDDLAELAAYAELDGDVEEVLSDDDIIELAAPLAPGTAALFVVWEDIWARDFGRAVRNAGGRLVAGERIPHDVVVDVFADLDEGGDDGESESDRDD